MSGCGIQRAQIIPYLSFRGECEAAFAFSAQILGGELGPIFRYGGTPLASQVPDDWTDKVMHATVTLGALVLQGADVSPDRYEEPKGFSLSIQIESPDEAERAFLLLSEGGRVVMRLEETFWAARFGTFVDRFGVPWIMNCEGATSDQ